MVTRRQHAAAAAGAALAAGTWGEVPDDVLARLIELSSAAALPTVVLLERRARTLGALRLATLKEFWRTSDGWNGERLDGPQVMGTEEFIIQNIPENAFASIGMMQTFTAGLGAGAVPLVEEADLSFTRMDVTAMQALSAILRDGRWRAAKLD